MTQSSTQKKKHDSGWQWVGRQFDPKPWCQKAVCIVFSERHMKRHYFVQNYLRKYTQNFCFICKFQAAYQNDIYWSSIRKILRKILYLRVLILYMSLESVYYSGFLWFTISYSALMARAFDWLGGCNKRVIKIPILWLPVQHFMVSTLAGWLSISIITIIRLVTELGVPAMHLRNLEVKTSCFL